MASSSWVIPVAVAVITPVVMGAIGRKNATQPTAQDGWVELRLPKFLVVLGWMTVGVAAIFVFGSISTLLNGGFAAAAICGVVAILSAWAAFMMIRDGRQHRLTYNEAQIRVTDGDGTTHTCAWNELLSGKVHPFSKLIHLRTKDGRVLKIYAYLIGSDAFFRALAERTDLPVAELVKRARYPG